MNLKFYQSLVLLLGSTLVGCSGGDGSAGLPTHPVTGKVTQNGSPVADVKVTFSPEGKLPAAFGRTGTDGTFTLTTYDAGDGAVEGTYKVLLTKIEGAASGPDEGHDPDNPGEFKPPTYPGERSDINSALPEEYASSATTPLTAEVTAGGENTFVFDL